MNKVFSASKSSLRMWLTVAAIIVLCAIPLFQSYPIRNRPLGEDEIYWTGQTYYFHLAFERRDWSNPDWRLLPGRENPVLGKFIIGLGLRLNGLSVEKPDWLGIFYIIAKERPNAWGNEQDRAERQAVLDRMEPATRELAMTEGKFEYPAACVLTARAVMMVFEMISIVLVFVLTSLYARPPTAFIAALLFSLHPAVVEAGTEVGVDILAIAFSLLAVIHFVLIERRVWRGFKRPALGRALICGGGASSVALAVGSKMNALIVFVLGTALCLVFVASLLRRRSNGAKESAVVMGVVLIGAMVIFVATNPQNYPNPVSGIWSVIADQQRSLEVQKRIPAVHHALESGGERLRALAGLTAFHPAIFLLVVAAFLVVAPRRGTGSSRLVVTLWWFIAVQMVVVWLPFARVRYVLPVVAPSVILLSIAGEILTLWVAGKMKPGEVAGSVSDAGFDELRNVPMKTPCVLIFMGVSGCGKTTVAKLFAARAGAVFYEGDEFHPSENISKMREGIPLTDADRESWLKKLRGIIVCALEKNEFTVLTCSALKAKYRDELAAGDVRIKFVHLTCPRAILDERLKNRQGHFMPLSLLESQLATLEPPSDAFVFSCEKSPEEIVKELCQILGTGAPG